MDVLKREPVRAAIYPLVVLVVGFCVARGVIDGETAAFVLAAAALILGALGVEIARSQVTPTKSDDA